MNDNTQVERIQFPPKVLKTFGVQLHTWGANVSAIRKGDKSPLHKWEHLQHERQSAAELDGYAWQRAAAVGVFNGPGGWRVFDIDAYKDDEGRPLAIVPESVLTRALEAIGLPTDYQWSYVSGSGAGYGFVIRCNEALPDSFPAAVGVYHGTPLQGLEYDHLELRWASGQTVIYGAHPTGPGYQWRLHSMPFVAPAERTAAQVVAAFEAIAELDNDSAPVVTPPAAGTFRGVGTFAGTPTKTKDKATAGTSAYARAALEDAAARVRTAPPGTRNNTLLGQARGLAQLVNGKELDEGTVKTTLEAAALAAGLTQKETTATIKSGFKQAGTDARQAPQGMNGTGIFAPDAAAPARSYHRTDAGNAQRLIAAHGENIRYVSDAKHWRVFNGRTWEQDTNGHLMRLAIDTARRIYAEASAIDDEGARKELAKHAMATEKRDRLNAMIALAQTDLAVIAAVDDFDKHPYLLAVRNGVLDLRTGQLSPHDKRWMLSRYVDIEYDARADCPTWRSFLDTIFEHDAAMIGYVKRAAGYSLTGDTSEQCFFNLWGKGRNGKSTFMHIIAAAAGDHYHRMPAEAVQAKTAGAVPNDIAQLPGKRIVIASELEAGRRMAESLVKDLTGGDDLSARFLFSEWFTFRPQAKLWIVGNHKLQIRGTDDGIWRRVRLIPFTVQIPESQVDRHMAQKLRAELPGILAWIVEGCLDWQRQGLNEPAAVLDATDEYRREQDFLADYLADCCALYEGASESASLLYQAFRQWCHERGEKELTQRTFSIMLRERGYERTRKTAGIIWHGLELTPTGRQFADRNGGFIPIETAPAIDI